MMEIDRISYIFGSFARRRQSQIVNSAKRRSIEPAAGTKISHDRSKSAPHQSKKTNSIPASPRAKSVYGVTFDDTKFKCPLCRKQFEEPRVLPCLHSFCLGCLQELEKTEVAGWCDDEFEVNKTNTNDSRKASSAGSGYISDSPSKGIICPTCGLRAEIPPGGVAFYPPNYSLQHRMALATLNSHKTHLLCDVCTSDVSATARCMECAISFCDQCEDVHLRQRSSADHEVLTLGDARKKGITRIRRQIMCVRHPDAELGNFCSTCLQVVCRDCISGVHRSHMCEPVSQAAKSHLSNLRLVVDRAKNVVEQSAVAANRLHTTTKQIETQCNRLQGEVEQFIDNYIKAVEEHRKSLLEQIQQVKQEQISRMNKEKLGLQKRIKDARDVAFFVDDLLNDGRDVEVLTFVKVILQKMERCDDLEEPAELKLLDSLQFLPNEVVQSSDNYTLYGVVTTQSVSPDHCHLNSEALSNLRVGRKVELTLETRDSSNTPLDRGGELVTAEVHHRDAGLSRSISVHVSDRRDGTYIISFIPDVAGKLALCSYIQGQPIKGSPFPIIVRTLKPHHGAFHCCSFCSSGGSKEATCGCDGSMPGGYKGCGHGHEGHPGRRHWSCCGNVLEHSECGRANSLYQFTL